MTLSHRDPSFSDEICVSLAERLYKKAIENTLSVPRNKGVPVVVITWLRWSINLGHIGARRLMARIILFRKHSLSPNEEFDYLKMAAKLDTTVAYALYEAVRGKGKFAALMADPSIKERWQYYYYVIKTGHWLAFKELLNAICQDKVTITPDSFRKLCHNCISFTRKISLEVSIEIALTLGGLLCGLAPNEWPALAKLELYNPELGLNYLKYILMKGQHETPKNIAYDLICHGIKKNMFQETAFISRVKARMQADASQLTPSIN